MSSTSGHVQLLRLLPSKDQDEFLRFIYPLRVRAAVFFAVIQLVYYAIDLVIIEATRQDIAGSPYYLAKRVAVLVLESVLIAVVCVGSIRVVSAAVHVWFFLTALSRLAILAYALTQPLSGTYLMSMLCTISLGVAGIATTMHISFVLVLAMTLPLLVLFSVAVPRSHGFDDDFPRQSASVYVLVIFATMLFVIHTVQYNTVMMFLWNQRYKTEKVEKDAQNRMELLHRMHLANTLHDIGSPLQAFTTGLEELKVWIAGLPKQYVQPIVHDALSGMEAAITLMSLARRRAIAYAKSFAHSESDTLQPQYTRVDIAQLAAESMKVVQALSRNRQCDVEIKYSLGADIPPVIWTDGDWIVEVLTNLLSNAVKFTDEGYIELRVFPTTKDASVHSSNASPRARSPLDQGTDGGGLYDGTHNPMLRFEVRDTGRGISADATEWLFQPFWQERGADRKVGSGLGLSSVKMKIEQLDGRVGANPNHPHGSVFWFEIPIISELQHVDDGAPGPESKWGDLSVAETPEKPPSPSQRQPRLQQPPSESDHQGDQKSEPVSVEELLVFYNIDASKIRVLLVEDEQMLRKFTKKLLARVGFQVDEACDGADGLRHMQQQAYDVVLMDQNMPQISGLEAVRMFREWQAQEETQSPSECDPLIFIVSASILEHDRAEAIDLRIAEFLEKPLHVNRIAAQVLARIAAHPELLEKFQRLSHCETCICQQLEDVAAEEQQEQHDEQNQREQPMRSATEAVSDPEEGIR